MEMKEMPYEEKSQGVLAEMDMFYGFVVPMVEKGLGPGKVAELRAIWQNESESIPENAGPQEKFEAAYRNWIRNWESAYRFVESSLGERGVEEFKREGRRANFEQLKKTAGRPALLMLRLMTAISPSPAVRTCAKQVSYQLQMFTPLRVLELSGDKLVLDARPCKVADCANGGAMCTVGCQQIYPAAFEPFGVNLSFNPQGKNCTITLARA